jgi:hypothetical protein
MREIPENPETWPAYRELVHAVIGPIAHLPVVLLSVCTPKELKDCLVIDTTSRTPAAVAAELARFVRSRHSSGDPADTGCRCLRADESGCTKDQ